MHWVQGGWFIVSAGGTGMLRLRLSHSLWLGGYCPFQFLMIQGYYSTMVLLSHGPQTNKQVHKYVHFEVSRLISSKLQSLLAHAVQASQILGSSHTPTSSFSRVSGLARTKENGFLPYSLSGLGSLKQPAAMAGHWQGTVSRRSGASIPAAPLL